MKLKDIIRNVGAEDIAGPLDIEITSITSDSRQVVPGSLFIAVKGFRAKGKRLSTYQIESITELEPTRFPEPPEPSAETDIPDEPDEPEENLKSEQQVIDEITGQTSLFRDEDF